MRAVVCVLALAAALVVVSGSSLQRVMLTPRLRIPARPGTEGEGIDQTLILYGAEGALAEPQASSARVLVGCLLDTGWSSSKVAFESCEQLYQHPPIAKLDDGSWRGTCRQWLREEVDLERGTANAVGRSVYQAWVDLDTFLQKRGVAVRHLKETIKQQPIAAARLLEEIRAHPEWVDVCVAGAHLGHTTAMFLAARPDIHVLTFDGADIGVEGLDASAPLADDEVLAAQVSMQEHGVAVADWLEARFPRRNAWVTGDPQESIPEFGVRLQGSKCDVMYIDGRLHTPGLLAAVLEATLKASTQGHLLAFHVPADPKHGPRAQAVLEEAMDASDFESMGFIQDTFNAQSQCVGRATPPAPCPPPHSPPSLHAHRTAGKLYLGVALNRLMPQAQAAFSDPGATPPKQVKLSTLEIHMRDL